MSDPALNPPAAGVDEDVSAANPFPQQIVTQLRNEHESFVQRLRWTKNILVKDTDLEDSDELFDFTPESSEYDLSESTSDGESDVSLTLNQTQHQLPEGDVTADESSSVILPDGDTTPPDKMLSLTGEASGREEPSSSQNTADDVVVSAYQKKDGGRVYNKRHYCLYCSKPYAKMARHLEGLHADKSDVAKALSLPKGSKERKKQLDFIRNRGNYAHNAAVMESGKGELVPFKRPHKKVQGENFMHCAYCRGLFTKKILWRHMRTCRLKPQSVSPKPGKNRVQSICTYTGPVPSNISQQLWGVISAMNPDPVTDIIKHDRVITEIGQHLLNTGGLSATNQQCVRGKMRELGRLVYNARRFTSLKSLEDCVNPKKYSETVAAVKYTCRYDSKTDSFMIPSLAKKLGNSLLKVSKLLKAQGLISNDKQLVRNASEFQEVHESQWMEMILATALRNIREAKWNVPNLLLFTEDVQKMHTYLSQVQDQSFKSLSESPSSKAWMKLGKVCLVQMILFNRRREEEVASMSVSAFLSRDASGLYEDMDWALSEVEKNFCRHFSRVITRGKCGRPVPVLLTPKMLCALELLVKQREACGVLKDNAYMFARPTALTHFQASHCLRGFAKACGAKCPNALTSVRLRKHAATLSAVLNMTEIEINRLANFLGHDVKIPGEFCQLSEKSLQLAKISKVLMALEQGRLFEFYGKNLDQLEIDPDEKVVESDEEDRSTQAGHASSAGKSPQRKCPWQQTEVQAVERHMMHFITSCTVPAKSDCETCLRAEPEALKNRDWKNLKFFIYNRITAYKKSCAAAAQIM